MTDHAAPPRPAIEKFIGLPQNPAIARLQALKQWVTWDLRVSAWQAKVGQAPAQRRNRRSGERNRSGELGLLRRGRNDRKPSEHGRRRLRPVGT